MRIDPAAFNLQVLGADVHEPWLAYADGAAHLCREVCHADDGRTAYYESLASARVGEGDSITFRLPLALVPIPPGTEPMSSRRELCVNGAPEAHEPYASPVVIVFVADN